MKSKKLSVTNQNTLDQLKINKGATQADVTRLINYYVKNGDKEGFNTVSNLIYDIEQQKHPDWTPTHVIDNMLKRFHGTSKSFVREEYSKTMPESVQIRPVGKQPKGIHDGTRMTKELRIPNGAVTTGASLIGQFQGKGQVGLGRSLKDIRDFENKMSQPTQSIKETPVVQNVPIPSGSFGVIPSQPVAQRTQPNKQGFGKINQIEKTYFDTASDLFKQNKPLIDKVATILTPESIQSGSWLTSIAGLAVPEIQIVSQLLNFTPLGISKQDASNLDKLARNESTGLSSGDETMLIIKSIINPDEIGKRLTNIAGSALGDIGNTISRAVGHKVAEPISQAQQDSATMVAGRKASTASDLAKQKYIEEHSTQPIPTGSSGVISAPPRMIDAVPPKGAAPQGTASQATTPASLIPPDVAKYGWTDPTVLDDIARWTQLVLTGRSAVPKDKAEYLARLKLTDPELYDKYQSEMEVYNWKLNKSTKTLDSDIDTSFPQNQNIIEAIQSLNDYLMKKSGKVTSDVASQSYDISTALTDVMKGTKQMSYNDIKNIGEYVMNLYPASVIDTIDPHDLKQLLLPIKQITQPLFEGDSDLSGVVVGVANKFNDLKKVSTRSPEINPDPAGVEPVSEEEKKIAENKVKDDENKKQEELRKTQNLKISEKRIETGSDDAFPRLRPRLEWGGTDELLIRKEDEFKNAQIYNEMMSINPEGWYNGVGNKLFLGNEKLDKMRYSNTFKLPPQPIRNIGEEVNPRAFHGRIDNHNIRRKFSYKNESLNDNFNQLQQPVWNSQYAPTDDGFKYARDQYDIGQFQSPTSKFFETTYPSVQHEQYHNYFPNTINSQTGGIPQTFDIMGNIEREYIVQMRFRK